jgi:hypothetical protein
MAIAEVRAEKRWPMATTLVAAVALTVSLPVRFSSGPPWIFPVIEAMLLLSVMIIDPGRIDRRSRESRILNIGLVVILVGKAAVITASANRRPDPRWSRDEFGDLATPSRVRRLDLYHRQFRLLVLGLRRRGSGGPGGACVTVSRPSFSRAAESPSRATGMATGVLRLPLPGIHQRNSVQPDRRHAAQTLGETCNGSPGHGVPGHPRIGDCPGGEHPEVGRMQGKREPPRNMSTPRSYGISFAMIPCILWCSE